MLFQFGLADELTESLWPQPNFSRIGRVIFNARIEELFTHVAPPNMTARCATPLRRQRRPAIRL